MKYLAGISLFIIFCPMIFIGQSFHIENYQWGIMPVDENITGRHENAFIEYKDRFYLMGGRGINPVDVYDPVNNIWSNNRKTPLEIHHFQPVVANNLIYLVGAMTGNYPRETPLETILIYDPESDQWSTGDTIPQSRRRGAGGVIFHDQWIYFIGGIQNGHISGTCAWADAYNIETGEWKILPDAPNARDHFFAVFHDDKIYCVGGRNTSYHEPDNFTAFFGATITAVDCYNITTGKWQTLADSLPIGTAGAPTVLLQDKIIVAGGESNQQLAHNETQVLDLNTLSWSLQNSMVVGRHGTMAVTWENKIYTAAGSGNRGGGDLTTLQVFSPNLNLRNLFNGHDLSGWQELKSEADANNKYWKASKFGTILCNSLGRAPKDYVWLMHETEFKDFELRLKFRVSSQSKGNSGIQIRSRYNLINDSVKKYWMDGPQVDIHPPQPWRTGLIYDETWEVRRWIYPDLESWDIDDTHAPEKIFFYYSDDQNNWGTHDNWNTLVIVCNEQHIQTFLNNIPVANLYAKEFLTTSFHKKRKVGTQGHIALQLHTGDEIYIEFKDILIREF